MVQVEPGSSYYFYDFVGAEPGVKYEYYVQYSKTAGGITSQIWLYGWCQLPVAEPGELICPFISGPYAEVPCRTSACMLYDVGSARCGANVAPIGDIIAGKLQGVRGVIDTVNANTAHVRVLQDHVHTWHLHPSTHRGSDLDVGPAPSWTDTEQPQASVLMQEFMNRQDLDGDDMIYGVDWKFEDDTVEKLAQLPFLLQKVQSMDGFRADAPTVPWPGDYSLPFPGSGG